MKIEDIFKLKQLLRELKDSNIKLDFENDYKRLDYMILMVEDIITNYEV